MLALDGQLTRTTLFEPGSVVPPARIEQRQGPAGTDDDDADDKTGEGAALAQARRLLLELHPGTWDVVARRT